MALAAEANEAERLPARYLPAHAGGTGCLSLGDFCSGMLRVVVNCKAAFASERLTETACRHSHVIDYRTTVLLHRPKLSCTRDSKSSDVDQSSCAQQVYMQHSTREYTYQICSGGRFGRWSSTYR